MKETQACIATELLTSGCNVTGQGLANELLDALPAHVAVLDQTGTIVAVNSHWRRFACANGGQEEGCIGANYLSVTECAKGDPYAEQVFKALRGVMDGRLRNFELEYPCHSGLDQRWFRCLLAPLGHLPDGRASAVMVMHIDTTETHLAQEAAQAAAEVKARFLATMSHEIRTPINTLLGAAQLLEMTELSARQAELLNLMMRSGHALDRLLRDVLDLSKIEAGRIELESCPFSPAELVREAVALVRIRAAEKGLDLTLDIDPAATTEVAGDPARLRQVLLNLIGNAVKFTPQGSVRVCADRLENTLSITVRDTGIGISPEIQARLFEPFVQGDSSISRRFGGSGLGLSICKRLIEAMNGSLSVESEPGLGTTASLTIPVSQPVSQESAENGAPCDNASAPLRLLLVEDEPAGREIIALLLESLGHHVTRATDACSGLAEAASGTFDAAVLDIQLPGIDGVSLARMLKSVHLPARLPIVALTANVSAEDRRLYEESGFEAVLGKPVLRSTLSATLGEFGRLSDAERHPPLFDCSVVERMVTDLGVVKVNDIIGNARKTVTSVLDEMRTRPALGALAKLAHKLKGCSAMVGLPWLHAIAMRLEATANAGNAVEAEDGRCLCMVWGNASVAQLEGWLALKSG